MRELLAGNITEDIRDLPLQQLASRALQLGLIDAQLADSINGLGVMRLLAAMDQDRLTVSRASEFASLAMAITYLIDLAHTATRRSAARDARAS